MVMAIYSSVKKFDYIFEVRDIYPEAFVFAGAIKRNSLIVKLFSLLTNKVYRDSLLIVCATYGIRKKIQSSESQSKTAVLLNGFPSSLIYATNKKYDRFTLVFHGTLGLFQDIELFCELVVALKPYHGIDILVIGDGAKSELVKRVEKSNPNLKYLGALAYNETINIVSKCHVGLSFRFADPLSMMSFPVKNWEYLGLSIPSIITPYGSEAGQFLDKNSCAVQVKSNSVKDILEIVFRFMHDKSYYQSYVSRCEKIKYFYTREKLSENLARDLLSKVGLVTNFDL
jgi:glycosyltransferase involved in cell wall biosynthesis